MQPFHRQHHRVQPVGLIALIYPRAAVGAPLMRADVVSATPGKYTGVILFNAPVVPTALDQ